jgi:hypothetical protein
MGSVRREEVDEARRSTEDGRRVCGGGCDGRGRCDLRVSGTC